MKFFITIITALTLLISIGDARSRCGAARVVINNNYDFQQTETQTFTTRYCWKGYKKLKRILKLRAKSLCSTRGTLCRRALVMKDWRKISCVKVRRHGNPTRVTVTATFKAMCNTH